MNRKIRSLLVILFLFTVLSKSAFAADSVQVENIKKFLDNRDRILNGSEIVTYNDFMSDRYFQFSDNKLKDFFDNYSKLKFDRYFNRGLSQRVVELKENIRIYSVEDRVEVYVTRLYELEYSFNKLVDLKHSEEEKSYKFVFKNGILEDYLVDDKEEMMYKNMTIDQIRDLNGVDLEKIISIKNFKLLVNNLLYKIFPNVSL